MLELYSDADAENLLIVIFSEAYKQYRMEIHYSDGKSTNMPYSNERFQDFISQYNMKLVETY